MPLRHSVIRAALTFRDEGLSSAVVFTPDEVVQHMEELETYRKCCTLHGMSDPRN
jgi:hypothetical protein